MMFALFFLQYYFLKKFLIPLDKRVKVCYNCITASSTVGTDRGDIMFAIDLRERTPIYEQLYKRITELVIKGELKQDDKLPSVRELAKELGVNPNTVAKAFQMLERDKVIYSLQGRGSFIAAVQTDSIKERTLSAFDAAVAEALKAGLTADELILRIKNYDEKGLDKNEMQKQEK